MILHLIPLLVIFPAWAAVAAPHQAAPGCCFSLSAVHGSDTVMVKQSTTGDLRVHSSFKQAFFCLNHETGLLQDGVGNNCFLESVTKQFQCFTGVPSFNSFSFAANSDGNKQLTYDGLDSFRACTSFDSKSDQGSFGLYSSQYEGDECFEVKLLQVDGTGTCDAPASYNSPLYVKSVHLDVSGSRPAVSDATGDEKCQLSARSPIIPPRRIGVGSFGDKFYLNTAGNGTITDTEGTLFEFTMEPGDFLHHSDGAPRLCAVQFSLPYCTTLPKGYPCFHWSGLQQQELAEAGMQFWHVYDSHTDIYWDPVPLVQVTPGKPVFGGTFDCKVDMDRTTERNVSFVATGVNDWSLEFAQGGVGDQADMPWGVGAYVVGCGDDTKPGPAPRPRPSPLAE